ncbi:hypothetical protein CFOL_v3_34111, partial [Cephalotus follicularis]
MADLLKRAERYI